MLLMCRPGRTADDTLATRLNALPASVGENTTLLRQRGESWVSIGIREHAGYLHLTRANPTGIAPNRRILIAGRHQVDRYGIRDGLILNLPELMVYRVENERVAAWYPISVGMITKRWHTPHGRLSIATLERNPTFYWYGGVVMPPGPNNPLGDRWIGLSEAGYGLHGTNDPTTIGRTVSHGCIRMFPPHVHELFDHVTVGMPVDIVYDTVTVGQQHGVVYLAMLPDIYSWGTNKPDAVRARLTRYGLEQVLTPAAFTARLRQTDGIARPLLGSTMPVNVNGATAAMTTGLTLRDGQGFLPLPDLANALGAAYTWDAASGATITHDGRTVTLAADGRQSFVALDTPFVPVRPLVERLGGMVKYDVNGLAISLSTG